VNTGYNTDVKHANRVFHIQTEDKGEGNPCVESHVYVGGEILATRRTSYEKFLTNGRDDAAIQTLMEQQHRTMIAAIQRGRFDGGDGSARSAEEPPQAAPTERGEETGGIVAHAAVPREGTPTPAGKTLDQVVLEYLTGEADQLEVTFDPLPDFVAGKPVRVRLRAQSSSHEPVSGATVQVRILSTAARAAVPFRGKTGADGTCEISFAVPAQKTGNAAAVIRVHSSVGSTEDKFPVRKAP